MERGCALLYGSFLVWASVVLSVTASSFFIRYFGVCSWAWILWSHHCAPYIYTKCVRALWARGEDSILLQINGKRKRHQKVRPCALFHPIIKHAGCEHSWLYQSPNFLHHHKSGAGKILPPCRRYALCCVYLSLHTQVSTHARRGARPEKDIASCFCFWLALANIGSSARKWKGKIVCADWRRRPSQFY